MNGDNTYGPVSFTPTRSGTYPGSRTYDGSSPNTLAATQNCPPVGDDGRDVIVTRSDGDSQTRQRWSSATTQPRSPAPAGTTLSGNVVFTLYNDGVV